MSKSAMRTAMSIIAMLAASNGQLDLPLPYHKQVNKNKHNLSLEELEAMAQLSPKEKKKFLRERLHKAILALDGVAARNKDEI